MPSSHPARRHRLPGARSRRPDAPHRHADSRRTIRAPCRGPRTALPPASSTSLFAVHLLTVARPRLQITERASIHSPMHAGSAVRRGLEPSGVHRSRRTERVALAGSKRPGRSEDDRPDGQLDLHSARQPAYADGDTVFGKPVKAGTPSIVSAARAEPASGGRQRPPLAAAPMASAGREYARCPKR